MSPSKIINLVLLVLLIAICVHERYLQRLLSRTNPATVAVHKYTDNPHYYEETDFSSLSNAHPAIVMMGNSMTRKIDWAELLGRCDIVNRGVNVDVTGGMLKRVGRVIALRPNIVFLEGGINDIDFKVANSEIASNIRSIADSLLAAGIIPVLTAVNHVNANYADSRIVNAGISELDGMIRSIAGDKHLDLIDLNPVIAPHDTLEHVYARGDGCHLTSKAYVVWLSEIQRLLKAHAI